MYRTFCANFGLDNEISSLSSFIPQDLVNDLGVFISVQVMCTYPSCSSAATRIVITDLCPGGTYCSTGEPAFDLSGAAITNMALPGRDGELRNIGLYNILYKRVPCEYPNRNIAFKIDAGSSNFWLSFTIKYAGGPGDTASVAIREVINFHGTFLQSCHNKIRTKFTTHGEN